MKLITQSPNRALKAFLKQKPHRPEIELFKNNLIALLDKITLIEQRPKDESEEHLKNDLRDFLRDTYYKDSNAINTKDKKDLVIHLGKTTDSEAGVIIEAKRPNNTNEMVTSENPNKKALHELILYYLDERIQSGNNQLKQLVITNVNEWFIIDSNQFDKHIYRNTEIKRLYETKLNDKKDNPFFYEEISRIVSKIDTDISCVYFDIREYESILRNNRKEDDRELSALFKILSPQHLLKVATPNDSNSLDEKFYKELLHIIGLEEAKENGKNIIRRKKENVNTASLIEMALKKLQTKGIHKISDLNTYGESSDDQYFNIALELCIVWINRILFLKLLEGQLIAYHNGDIAYLFMNKKIIHDFDELFKLFHNVLAVDIKSRDNAITQKYKLVPYLNSSLFEITDLEDLTICIDSLDNSDSLELIGTTILKDIKKKTASLPTLDYLFQFLDAYNFASVDTADIQEDNKTIINASVLGKVFEKINGYKDGSIFTPAFITMYMCNQSIRLAVVEKFNKALSADGQKLFDKFEDVKNYASRLYKTQEILKANEIINSLRICDPAVGSGHFLVSSLNEIIAIKAELGILADENGSSISGYEIEIVNDELIITDSNSNIFEYKLLNGKPLNKETQRLQKTLFHEKQTIIENCLFGVDINPNSVKICRLRLWIELLKNAYYKDSEGPLSRGAGGVLELETLPNIDINIKCGNSLLSRFALDADLSKALKNSKYDVIAYRDFVNKYKNEKSRDVKRELQNIIDSIKNDLRTEILNNDPKIVQWKKFSNELYNLVNQEKLFELNAKQKKAQKDKQKKLELDINKLNKEIEEIKTNAIYKNAFEWRFEFPEVLNNEGDFEGFDLVIGNPPYGAKIGELEKDIYKSKYEEYHTRWTDTFNYFIPLSFSLVRFSGMISLIVPNNFLFQNEYEKARLMLLNTHRLLLSHNLGDDVFKDANVPTAILLALSKHVENYDFYYSDLRQKHKDDYLFDTRDLSIIHKNDILKSASKVIGVSDKSTRLINKISLNSVKIDDIAFEVANGIQPTGDKIFRINKEVINKYKIEDIILKKVLVGSDFTRYSIPTSSHYVIYTNKETNLSSIPNTINYLSEFKSKLSQKRETKKGTLPWWCLHWPRYKGLFENKKIILRQTSDKLIATIDEEGFYAMNNVIILQLPFDCAFNYSYILCLLNSNVLNFIYQNITQEIDRTFAEVKPINIRKLPIKNISVKSQKPFIDLVNKILKTKQKGKDSTALEKKIDEMVYKLYDLTEEEIKIVEEKSK